MTIDEAIKIIDADALYSPECAKFCKDALEELKWYREHDLIDREDVLWVVKYNCDQPKKLMRVIEEMPKAEPPNSSEIKRELNETKNERNGDCETCKHYHEDWFDCDSCYSRYDEMPRFYEPYVPDIIKAYEDNGLVVDKCPAEWDSEEDKIYDEE